MIIYCLCNEHMIANFIKLKTIKTIFTMKMLFIFNRIGTFLSGTCFFQSLKMQYVDIAKLKTIFRKAKWTVSVGPALNCKLTASSGTLRMNVLVIVQYSGLICIVGQTG